MENSLRINYRCSNLAYPFEQQEWPADRNPSFVFFVLLKDWMESGFKSV